MAYVFTATHGVTFADTDRKRRPDGGWDESYEVWADFVPDTASSNLVNGVTVKAYRFETTDSKIAARLRKVEGYGITEAKPEKADPKAGDGTAGDGTGDTGDGKK